jgi:hypothetical protein
MKYNVYTKLCDHVMDRVLDRLGFIHTRTYVHMYYCICAGFVFFVGLGKPYIASGYSVCNV